MKLVKFQESLVPLVLSGEKTSTWRLFDEKDLSEGDELELREFGTADSFAFAVVTRVVEKPFRDLTEADKLGHEQFVSDAEMYATYSNYYKTEVNDSTTVKLNWFRLLKK